ncbi:MAG: YXWGXW repeat-containing protein, partial [bacterium]
MPIHHAAAGGDTVAVATAPDADAQGVQVLTRGPVHEAFAGIVIFNPEPGIVVPKAPPEAIEEVPPGERPEGNNVTWIPGYWAWDEERTDFVWVSGTWRALPPGRQWMAGYWGETTKGFQWTSGYWADATTRETTYLAAPPATVEDGPNVAAPSADYRWTPGNWIWSEDRYAWGPGHWARGRADWDWSPSHYVWTPRGYIFVDGYWDYPVNRRGSLFAPVYFNSGVYSQSGYSYSPAIAIDLAVFAEALFLRPHYNHYYFGDYYDNSYQQNGYYSAYAYQSSSLGYDPIYSQQRWQHRQDKGWDSRMAASYQYRQANVSARPPRTWSAQQAISSTSSFKQGSMLVATPLTQMASRKNSGVRYQPVTKVEQQALSQRSQQVGVASTQRRTQEAKGTSTAALKPGELMAPSKVEHARSPIVAKAPSQLGKGNAPPAAQRPAKAAAAGTPTPRQPIPGATNPAGAAPNAAATPGNKQALPEPRKPAATPGNKQTPPEPRNGTA